MEVVPSTSAQDTDARHERQPIGQRSAPLVGRRSALATQQPRSEARPAGPSDGAITVSTKQRRDDRPVVVPISRPRQPTAEPSPSPSSTERVPSDLRAQLEPMLNADLSDVPVHRGAPSARAASDMSARAFTVGSEVHLPDKLGPTSHGEARETLAHELTHVVQQRRLGSVAPDESSAAGEHMEAEARQVARRVATPQRVSVAPPAPRRPSVPMVHHPPPQSAATPLPPQVPTSSLSPTEARQMVSHVEDAALSSGMATAPARRRSDLRREPFGDGDGDRCATRAGDEQRAPRTDEPRHRRARRYQPHRRLDPRTSRRARLARSMPDIRSRLRHDLLVQRERADRSSTTAERTGHG